MPRWIRISLKVLACLLAIVFVLWAALAIYVSRNEKKITEAVTRQINENISGEVKIGSMETSLFRGFPFASLSLRDVSIRDSLYHTHKRELLNAKELFVKLNVLSLLKNQPQIRTVYVNTAIATLFVDSSGYSNLSVFRSKDSTKGKKEKPHINNIVFNDVVIRFEEQSKSKLFQLNIRELDGSLDYGLTGWKGDFKINTLVKHMAFNNEKGSFLKDKVLKTQLRISYDDVKRIMDIPIQDFRIGPDKFRIGGTFNLQKKPTSFTLHIIGENIGYRNITALLSASISSKLNGLDFAKPVSARALLKGNIKYRDTPTVTVSYNIVNNILSVPDADLKNISFKGFFTNEVVEGAGHSDRNSAIHVFGMKASWEGIPVAADTVRVYNLIEPILEGRFRSQFALTKLNQALGSRSFHFSNGTADVNLLYRAGLKKDDSSRKYIYGTVRIDNAAMTYRPRGLKLNNCDALLRFTGDDLLMQRVNVQTANTNLNMDGRIANFANLYYHEPGKILLDWNIRSPQINLNEFLSFLGKRNAATGDKMIGPQQQAKEGGNTRKRNFASRLDRILDESNVHMNMDVGRLIYKRFKAEQVRSEINMNQAGIDIQHIALNHAGGKITALGSIQQSGSNRFDIKANMDNVNVQELFYAFENFGQEAITTDNIRGRLNTTVNMQGNMRNNGQIVPKSMHGTVNFDLQNGRLLNFEPFGKLARFIFRNRNLSDIELRKLENTLEIQGNKIYIRPMTIESSAINLFVRGVYGIPTGTHIEMDVPLRNPKKDELITNPYEKQEKMRKGIILYLKAIDGEDGKVKIQWNKKEERTQHVEG